jgi:hypothetical protein
MENELKHLEHKLKTYIYIYSHCNMCNIPIYFCNINMKQCNIYMKHLKHLKHTLATWALFGRMEACQRGGRQRHMSLCGSGTSNLPAGAMSQESRPPSPA